MLRSYWGIVVAVIGWLVLVSATQQGSREQPREQPKAQAETRQSALTGAPPPAEAAQIVNRPVLERQCGQGHNDRQSDLCAQWKAADAASKAAWWAAVATFVTATGTIGLFWQIKLTREAVQDTAKATEAIGEANAIARDIGQAQTRAYLSIETLEVKKIERGLEFKATIKNSGNSPALAAQIMLDVMDYDGSTIKIIPEQEHNVAPQSISVFAYCYLKSENIPKVTTVVVFATVGYADVFGSFDKITMKFADLMETWNTESFTPMTAGMHVESYIRSMSPT
jgi:hypothetical protein